MKMVSISVSSTAPTTATVIIAVSNTISNLIDLCIGKYESLIDV